MILILVSYPWVSRARVWNFLLINFEKKISFESGKTSSKNSIPVSEKLSNNINTFPLIIHPEAMRIRYENDKNNYRESSIHGSNCSWNRNLIYMFFATMLRQITNSCKISPPVPIPNHPQVTIYSSCCIYNGKRLRASSITRFNQQFNSKWSAWKQ